MWPSRTLLIKSSNMCLSLVGRTLPFFYHVNAAAKVIAYLIDPEALDVPAELEKPLITHLITTAQFAGPVPVIALAIDLDVQFALTIEESEVEVVLFDLVLRDGTNACLIE